MALGVTPTRSATSDTFTPLRLNLRVPRRSSPNSSSRRKIGPRHALAFPASAQPTPKGGLVRGGQPFGTDRRPDRWDERISVGRSVVQRSHADPAQADLVGRAFPRSLGAVAPAVHAREPGGDPPRAQSRDSRLPLVREGDRSL